MSDLTLNEQQHVRTALRNLHFRIGTWAAVADSLRVAPKTLESVVGGRTVTAGVALRLARLLNASVDDLLAGRLLPGACPHCGYLPNVADPVQQSSI